MLFKGIFVLLFSSLAAGASLSAKDDATLSTDPSAYDSSNVIYRDVAVIGGGSSGTYTAVRLRDHNKTVAVIERKDHLGGHAETYTDPINGYIVDIGVIVFDHIKTVNDYFARFNVPLVNLSNGGSPPTYVDFSTGKTVNYKQPSSQAFVAALNAYQKQLNKYPALADSFNISYPVDPDLLLPFGDFVAKYQLQNLFPPVFASNQGYVPLLNISTLYMLKYLNAQELYNLQYGFQTTAHHNIQELYQKAAKFLGPDAMMNSSVLAMDRSRRDQARILVQTPSGRKLVVAKKIVSTAPPIVNNLKGYDLSRDEKSLFSQFYANGYYTGILNNTGLPVNTSLSATGPGQTYNIPKLPGPYSFSVNPGVNLTQVYYASPTVMSDDDVKSDILKNLQRVQKSMGISTTQKPDWIIFSSHAPFNLMVSNDAIKSGFYKKLFGLQGQRNTFYNGAAWDTQDSSVLWRFTDNYVLPILLASL